MTLSVFASSSASLRPYLASLRPFFSVLAFLSLSLGAYSQSATLVITNATVYTVNKNQPTAEAVAMLGDKIVFVGSNNDIKKYIGSETQVIDAKGMFLMPGLIEGHGHIHGLGASLINLNLMKAKNWDEIVAMVGEAAKKAKPGDWIIGRGWHQEKWDHAPAKNYLGYPYYQELDKVSPNNPVLLSHASGHSVYVNGMALKLAGINDKTPNPVGGDIVKDKNGQVVGVLEEKAMSLVYPPYNAWLQKRPLEERKADFQKGIKLAENECLRNGVTSFVDAGSSFEEVALMREMAGQGKMDIRHWVMVRAGIKALKENKAVFPVVNEGNGHLTVKAVKVSLDGALGSYGAWFLEPYSDRKDTYGQNTFPMDELREVAGFCWENNLQLCVHAIGDRANRETINIYSEQIIKNKSKDHRWRIEHAQHVNPAEIPRFKEWSIIASVQGIHCTSDAPYVIKRLGEERAATGAYMWRAFTDAGVLVNNGTDVPVENIDPFANIYASVTRKLADGSTFFPAQKMTRDEALYSYTMANAIATFEEKSKGSIEAGKYGDLVLVSNNLANCPEDQIKSTKVLMTIVGGKLKYQSRQ